MAQYTLYQLRDAKSSHMRTFGSEALQSGSACTVSGTLALADPVAATIIPVPDAPPAVKSPPGLTVPSVLSVIAHATDWPAMTLSNWSFTVATDCAGSPGFTVTSARPTTMTAAP